MTLRRVVAFFLLMAMSWQAIALARPGSSINVLDDPAHAALHWQGTHHHHHDDGSVRCDDTPDSAQHVLIDDIGMTAGLTSIAIDRADALPSTAPPGGQPGVAPSPFLEGPLKPPRLHA